MSGAPLRAERPMTDEARAILERARSMRDDFVDLLTRLARHESPTDRPETQAGVQTVLITALRDLGYDTRIVRGRSTGGHLYARPSDHAPGVPAQLLIGHTDTVWPVGTLDGMPVHLDQDRLYGPGTFDMKGGLTVMVLALRILRDLGLRPPAAPVVFINSDEETGSPESARWVRMLARRACRAFILEPGLGSDGLVKTERKGVRRFDITIHGRASHAGLAPEAGVSAIVELAHVVQALDRLNDPARGTTVNVGVVEGGVRPNVVAPLALAGVDVRVRSGGDATRVAEAIFGLRPTLEGIRLEVSAGVEIPPLERTPRNRALWKAALAVGRDLGMELAETSAGGGSDGNTTSRFTATLDGLGCVGDGAHAVHEHVLIDASLERCALLACLMLAPVARVDSAPR